MCSRVLEQCSKNVHTLLRFCVFFYPSTLPKSRVVNAKTRSVWKVSERRPPRHLPTKLFSLSKKSTVSFQLTPATKPELTFLNWCSLSRHFWSRHIWVLIFFFFTSGQCWGKLLLKVMHYNIALLPKKLTNYVSYFLWKVMRYVTF